MTASQLLAALSGLVTGTAAQHLLAARHGVGPQKTIFGARYTVHAQQAESWVLDRSPQTFVFAEPPRSARVAASQPQVWIQDAPADVVVPTARNCAIVICTP